MRHQVFGRGIALVLGGILAASAVARGDEDPRIAAQFAQALREKGYFDLAADYLEQLRGQPDAPADLIATIDFELGGILLDDASRTGDLLRRKELLELARGKLESFTKTNPGHPRAPEALLQLARLLVERGHLSMLQADETEVKAEKDAKLVEARAAFGQARQAYNTAATRLKDAYSKFPTFIPDGDPRRKEREQIHTGLMQSLLQKAVVDYEEGQTHPLQSKERTDLLTSALGQFDEIYKNYRQWMAGLTARMWQGKCYEERGDLGKAMGIYNELMTHEDPVLRPLQRHVGFFRIIVMGKRKEYALAADEAVRWLQTYNTPESLRTKEGVGVQLELAKNIIAQLPQAETEGEKSAATKRIIDSLGNVIRYPSSYKAEALALLKKYKPSAAASATEVAKLNYDEAIAAGDQAIAAHEWDRAVMVLKHAIRRAESARDIDKTNQARYTLAFCYYMTKRYYEAAVLCDHLARRYPRGGLSAKATEIGMAALADAYNTYNQVDRGADLENLIELAKYTAETYPDSDEGDKARMNLGMIFDGTGRYSKAIEAYESVRAKSSRSLEAQTKLGSSRWMQSQVLRREGKTAAADDEVKKALATLESALKTRRDSNTPPTDPDLVSNACDIADIHIESGKPEEALKLLEPLARQQTPPYSAAFPRLMADSLRAHIAVGKVDLAIADMAKLEKEENTGAGLTGLYFELGKLLEKEMDRLDKKGDQAGKNRTKQAYLKFLSALVGSKSGHTYESLTWAGESMLGLGNAKEAEGVFQRILAVYSKDEKFLAQSGSGDRLLRARLGLSGSYRGQGKFKDAQELVDKLVADNPKTIDPLMEQGKLLEDKATAGKAKWTDAFAHWQKTALRLGAARSKPLEYYEAWYHAAISLNKGGKPKEARQTLASVMRLSASVGGPEMKSKYKTLLNQIK